jgi:hypothetical protein
MSGGDSHVHLPKLRKHADAHTGAEGFILEL